MVNKPDIKPILGNSEFLFSFRMFCTVKNPVLTTEYEKSEVGVQAEYLPLYVKYRSIHALYTIITPLQLPVIHQRKCRVYTI